MSQIARTTEIVVLAGANGSGKSSIAGTALRATGSDYFNPDEATGRFLQDDPSLLREEANSLAWHKGRDLLTRAIEKRSRFAFETTLGGRTMTRLLMKASNVGIPVRIWYMGLESFELHLDRVRARVRGGGHDIPEDLIRARYDSSRKNLISLLPHLAELKLYDNSTHGDPAAGERPQPILIVHMEAGQLIKACPLGEVPGWAKPIVAAATETFRWS